LNNFQKILLVLILILIPLSYFVLTEISKQKVIVIPPIEVVKVAPKENIIDTPDTILSNLKVAVHLSNEEEIISKEEEANEVLKVLQDNIHLPIIKEKIIKTSSGAQAIETLTSQKKIPIKKYLVQKKIVKKHKVKKYALKKSKEPIKTTKVSPKSNTLAQKKIVKEKPTLALPINIPTANNKTTTHHLSREQEVALYKQQHAKGLEIVGESKTFEIKDPTQSLPDEYYFKKHNPKVNQAVELNQFVETLGVVKVSKQYEVQNKIPQKVELAKDGVVDISTASIETKELKRLKFVKPLEVTEVSETFEASQAKRYLP